MHTQLTTPYEDKVMDYELIINPTNKKYHPNRYKAVLLLNGGLSKGYPKKMRMADIMEKVANEVNSLTDGTLKLTHN